jgi:hypothetical protein
VKNAERLPGVDEILLPSERGNRVAQQRISSGMAPIEANLYHNLKVRLNLFSTLQLIWCSIGKTVPPGWRSSAFAWFPLKPTCTATSRCA